MKILIVGCGAQGSVIATQLAKNREVEEVRCADVDSQRARGLAQKLKKANAYKVDAGNLDNLTKIADGVSVVVNATLPKYNMNVMDAALRSGAHYLDMASGIDPEPYESLEFEVSKQLALNDKWRDAGLTALLGGGISPGTTNVLAAYAADKLDQVNEIRIRHGYRVLEKPTQKTYATWSPEISWACTAKPIVFENGKLREVPPFGGEETYTFPDPVGQCTVAYMLFAHEEVVTLPRFIGKGLKYVDLKSAHVEPVQKALYQLGFLGTKAVRVKDIEVVPRDVLLKVLPKTLSSEDVEKVDRAEMLGNDVLVPVVDIRGEKAGKKMNYILYVKGPTFKQVQKKLLGANCVSYLTGTSAAVFTDMLGKREVETKGAFPPECLEPTAREIFINRLSKQDIEVYEHVERSLS